MPDHRPVTRQGSISSQNGSSLFYPAGPGRNAVRPHAPQTASISSSRQSRTLLSPNLSLQKFTLQQAWGGNPSHVSSLNKREQRRPASSNSVAASQATDLPQDVTAFRILFGSGPEFAIPGNGLTNGPRDTPAPQRVYKDGMLFLKAETTRQRVLACSHVPDFLPVIRNVVPQTIPNVCNSSIILGDGLALGGQGIFNGEGVLACDIQSTFCVIISVCCVCRKYDAH